MCAKWLLAALVPFGPLSAQEEPGYGSFLGGPPPELVAGENGWIDRQGDLSLAALRGQVVWIEFSYLH